MADRTRYRLRDGLSVGIGGALVLLLIIALGSLVVSATPSRNNSASDIQEPSLSNSTAVTFLPSGYSASSGLDPMESHETRAEAFVHSVAFLPGSNSVIYTVIGSYPDHRALYSQSADPISGALAPTATLHYAPPNDIDFLSTVSGVPGQDYVIVSGRLRSDVNSGTGEELYRVSGDGSSDEHLTAGLLAHNGFAVDPQAELLHLVDDDGQLVSVDMESLATAVITSGLYTTVGIPSGALSVSPTGDKLAVVSEVGTLDQPMQRLSLYEMATQSWATVADLGDGLIAGPLFSSDGATVFYADNTTMTSGENLIELYQVAAQPHSIPVFLGQLSDDIQPTTINVLQAHPNHHAIIYLNKFNIMEFDLDTHQISALTLPDERVVYSQAITTTPHGSWLAYVVRIPLSSDTVYVGRDGTRRTDGYLARLMRLQ